MKLSSRGLRQFFLMLSLVVFGIALRILSSVSASMGD